MLVILSSKTTLYRLLHCKNFNQFGIRCSWCFNQLGFRCSWFYVQDILLSKHMSTMPIQKGWREVFNKYFTQKNMLFYVIHEFHGFINVRIVINNTMLSHSPVYVGDLAYIYEILLTTLVEVLIPDMVSLSRLTIAYSVSMEGVKGLVTFTIGNSINLTDDEGFIHPLFVKNIFTLLHEIKDKGFDSSRGIINEILLKVRYSDHWEKSPVSNKKAKMELAYQELALQLEETLGMKTSSRLLEVSPIPQEEASPHSNSQNKKFGFIQRLKNVCSKKKKPFFVSDLETILNDKGEHVPYAIGLLRCIPDEPIYPLDVVTWFSEDHIHLDSFYDRSTRMLSSFIKHIESVVRKQRRFSVVYFQNFSRFDGILLTKHLVINHSSYKLKPLMRNGVLYEIKVYFTPRHSFIFRDSIKLLPSSLESLAKDLCPEFGSKGRIDFNSLTLENLPSRKEELILYMKQDIILLAGVMLKAQHIIHTEFNVDLVNKITISSLALTIFRAKFYEDDTYPIHIPSANVDSFIRKGYYGGHTDVYKPHGKDLFYYDVNSLYPFVMKTYPMPIGKPQWHGNLIKQKLEDIYGFVEAYIVCPIGIKRPLLPCRQTDGSLVFPTGRFFGVYYSEELKMARDVGYKVEPLRGYLYQKGEGLFAPFVESLASKRTEAKKEGKVGMSFVLKILMNSLYGRFGINPRSTVTELCSRERYCIIEDREAVVSAYPLTDSTIICSYWSQPDEGSSDWYPKLGAVQIAAAITASARMFMYEYISLDDCYYTDTDSVVLKNPLHPDVICDYTLGKFKLEYRVKEGFFLAPKSYSLLTDKDSEILVHKGAAKPHVTRKWFEEQLLDPEKSTKVEVTNPFRVDTKQMVVRRVVSEHTLSFPTSSKREMIYNKDGRWVDTKPVHVELKGVDERARLLIERLEKQTK